MRIFGVRLAEIRLPLREAFASRADLRAERRILLVEIRGSEGAVGWGECVAGETPAYTSETTETAWHVLTRWILPGLPGREVLDPVEILAPVRWIRGHRMALAAVEMACWDLQAKELGLPLRELLGAEDVPIRSAIAIGLQPDREGLLRRVRDAVERGYALVKLKVDPAVGLDHLRIVRAELPDLPLAIDANGGWAGRDPEELAELDDLGLELIEQPLGRMDFVGHARLQERLRTPICLDESLTGEDELRLALHLGACRAASIKPGLVGGLRTARRMHDLAREAGVPMRIGGMLESGIGRAHNLALAALPGFSIPGDVSESARYWERDVVVPPLSFDEGRMPPTRGVGIGVEPDRARIDALTVRELRFGELAGAGGGG